MNTEAYRTLRRAKIVHDLSRPLRERAKSRRVVGPYHFFPHMIRERDGDQVVSFYLGSDFAPDLRIQEVTEFGNHPRWYADPYQDQTITGIVARLPHGRGFLAGWTMGEGMISVLERDVYPDLESAISAADDLAMYAAEREYETETQEIEQ